MKPRRPAVRDRRVQQSERIGSDRNQNGPKIRRFNVSAG
jgi:hypothetical protein